MNDSSSDSGFYTSNSEYSETDENSERNKSDDTSSKIRNYCAACLANIFR